MHERFYQNKKIQTKNKTLESICCIQVRSASFDEIQLETQRSSQFKHQTSADERTGLLQVPQQSSQRSRSFDSAGSDDSGTFLEVPRRFQRRRSSNTKTPPPCIHCQYLEEYEKSVGAHERFFIDQHEVRTLSYSDTSSSEEEEEELDFDFPTFGNTLLPPAPITSPCGITFTLSPTNGEDYPQFPSPSALLGSPPALSTPPPAFPPSPTIELPPDLEDLPSPRSRRRSISRQEAIFVEPTGNSLENVTNADEQTTTAAKKESPTKNSTAGDIVRDIYLTVPDLKRDRAASVDSCFSKVSSAGKTEELQLPDGGLTLTVPSGALRSRSVDIVLPTDEQARYKALALAGPSSAAHYSRGYVVKYCCCCKISFFSLEILFSFYCSFRLIFMKFYLI